MSVLDGFQLYPPILVLHVAAALSTGLYFLVRLAWRLRHLRRPAPPARRVAWAIDSVLLGAGILLAVLTGQAPWRVPWLAAKLAMLALYIVLGMVALHWSRGRPAMAASGALALLVYAQILAVALTRSPWGLLRLP